MNDLLIKECVSRIKDLATWREPRYELPADSHLENIVIDILEIYKKHGCNKWISVKDRLPLHWSVVLVFNKNNDDESREGIHSAFIDEDGKWLCSLWKSLSRNSDKITHWMPLPELPDILNEIINDPNNIDPPEFEAFKIKFPV